MNDQKDITQFSLLPIQSELIERLRWFTRIRWMAVAGTLATVLAARWVFGFEMLPVTYLLSLVGVIAFLNLGYVLVLRRFFPEGAKRGTREVQLASIFAQVQILLDLILLTLLLYFSGGAYNPFCFFYIFHVVISSMLLPRFTAYAYAVITVVFYSGLILIEQVDIVKTYPVVKLIEVDQTYLVGMIFAFSATVFFAAYLTTSIRLQLKHGEEEAARVRNALIELEEQKSGFLRMVSHELRSPIASIKSSLSVLLSLEEEYMDDDMRRSVERASDRAQALFQLTRDLLEFSRLTMLSPREKKKKKIDFIKVVKNTKSLYQPQAADRKIEFNVDVPEEKIIMLADPQSMEQMVDNLVSNAIRYTSAGGKVNVKLGISDGNLQLTVSDTGIGIPAEDIDRIGEEFYRSRNAKHFAPSGTGIGMRIIREIIRQHGGKLNIQSKEGEGATFTVDLPLTHTPTGSQ